MSCYSAARKSDFHFFEEVHFNIRLWFGYGQPVLRTGLSEHSGNTRQPLGFEWKGGHQLRPDQIRHRVLCGSEWTSDDGRGEPHIWNDQKNRARCQRRIHRDSCRWISKVGILSELKQESDWFICFGSICKEAKQVATTLISWSHIQWLVKKKEYWTRWLRN